MTAKQNVLRQLMKIPGVGKSISQNLRDIGITSVADLQGKNPEKLYRASNEKAGVVQDRCLLYVFRCAVYYANTPIKKQNPSKLLWWNWKDDFLPKRKKAIK